MGLRAIVCVLAASLVLAACRVDATVTVRVGRDGSGTVTARVVLDRDAVTSAEVGGATLEQRIRVADLSAAGWHVGPWARAPNGSASLTISKHFGKPSDLSAVIGELSGAHGPLRRFALTRRSGVLRTSYRLRGDADLATATAGVTGDRELVASLAAQRVDPAALDARLIAQLRGSVTLVVVTALPGGGRRSVRVAPGGRAAVDARTSTLDTTRIAFEGAGVVLGVAALVLLVSGRRRRRRA